MKALLDTNIVIHREASKVINKDIGQLFFWLDKTKHEKFIHPLTVDEINKYKDNNTVETMNIKLDSYNILKTTAPFDEPIKSISEEKVYIRDFKPKFDKENPRYTYPYFSKKTNIWFVSIFPEYHTELFPDSILRNESPIDFVENEPHRNAISKVYVSHSKERNIKKGDTIVFYRTGGLHKGVVTTIGVAESAINPLVDFSHLVELCKNKSVSTESKLKEFWERFGNYKPFVVNFLYCYSLPKRPNLAKLIELGIIAGPDQMPRGFSKITENDLIKILKVSESNESIVVD